jgi:hypothetical protein
MPLRKLTDIRKVFHLQYLISLLYPSSASTHLCFTSSRDLTLSVRLTPDQSFWCEEEDEKSLPLLLVVKPYR